MRLLVLLVCYTCWARNTLAYELQQQQQAPSLFETGPADKSVSAGSFTVKFPNNYANEVPSPPAAPPSSDNIRYSKAVPDTPRSPINSYTTEEQNEEERYIILDAYSDDYQASDQQVSLFDDQASEVSYVSLPASAVSLFDDTPDVPNPGAIPHVIVNNYNNENGAQRQAATQSDSRGDIYISVHTPAAAPATEYRAPAPKPASDFVSDTTKNTYAQRAPPAGPVGPPQAPPQASGKASDYSYDTQSTSVTASETSGTGPLPPAIPRDEPAQAAPFLFQSNEGSQNKVSLTWSQFDATLTPSTDVGKIIQSITGKGPVGEIARPAPVGPVGGSTFVRPPAPQMPQPPAPPQDFLKSNSPPSQSHSSYGASSADAAFASEQFAPPQYTYAAQPAPPSVPQAPPSPPVTFQQAAPPTGTYGSVTSQAAPPQPGYVIQQSAPAAATYASPASQAAPNQPTYVFQQAPPAIPQPPQNPVVFLQQVPSAQYVTSSQQANPSYVYQQAPAAAPPSSYDTVIQANSPPTQNQPTIIVVQGPASKPQSDEVIYDNSWRPSGPNSPQIIVGSGYESAKPPSPPADEGKKGGHTYNYYYIINKNSDDDPRPNDPAPPAPPAPPTPTSSYGFQSQASPPQAPPRNPSGNSYGGQQAPPQNPSQSYAAPPAPPQNPTFIQPPPQNPSSSYGSPQSPPQNPVNSYGGLQAPPQNPVNFNSYGPASNPPAQSDFSGGYGAPAAPAAMSVDSYLPVRDPPSMGYGVPQAPAVRDPPSMGYGVPQTPAVRDPPSSSYGAPPATQPLRNPPSSSYGVPQAPVQTPSLSYGAPQFTQVQDDVDYYDEEEEEKGGIFDKLKEIKIFKASKSKGKGKGKNRRPTGQQQVPQSAPMSYGYGNRPSSPQRDPAPRDPVLVSSPNLNVNYQYQYNGPPIIARPAGKKKNYKKLFYKGTLAMGGLGLLPNMPGVIYGRKRRESPFFGEPALNATYGGSQESDIGNKQRPKRLSNGKLAIQKSLFDDLPFQGAPIPPELRNELKEYLPSEEVLSDAQCLQKTFCATLVKLGDTEYRKSFLLFYSALAPDADENEWIKEALTAAKKNACDEFYCQAPDVVDNDLDDDKAKKE